MTSSTTFSFDIISNGPYSLLSEHSTNAPFFDKPVISIGDGLLLIVTGIYLGLEENLKLFLCGLFLCGLWALGLVLLRKKSRKDSIPFVPFLLAAYMGMLGNLI